MQAQISFLEILLEYTFVLMREKPVDPQGLVQGGMGFFQVAYRQEVIAQVQAVGGQKTVPFPICQTGAVSPCQMSLWLLSVVAHQVFPCIA